jgi:hypothetical protein
VVTADARFEPAEALVDMVLHGHAWTVLLHEYLGHEASPDLRQQLHTLDAAILGQLLPRLQDRIRVLRYQACRESSGGSHGDSRRLPTERAN